MLYVVRNFLVGRHECSNHAKEFHACLFTVNLYLCLGLNCNMLQHVASDGQVRAVQFQ